MDNSFSLAFAGFGALFEQEVVSFANDVGKDVLRALTNTAPVDTSRFVSNMNVSLNAPNESHDDNKFIGPSGSYAAGVQVLAAAPKNYLYDIHFVNTISYGEDLEIHRPSPKAADGTFRPSFVAISSQHGFS